MGILKKLLLGIFVSGIVLVAFLVTVTAVLLVPPASERTLTSIDATFVRSGPVLNADAEDDLFIYVEEYASPFRINRAAEGGFLAEQFVAEVSAGDRIEIVAFKRYLPRNPQNEIFLGSMPTWTIVKDDIAFMPDRILASGN